MNFINNTKEEILNEGTSADKIFFKVSSEIIWDGFSYYSNKTYLEELTIDLLLEIKNKVENNEIYWYTYTFANDERVVWVDPEGIDYGWIWSKEEFRKDESNTKLKEEFKKDVLEYLENLEDKLKNKELVMFSQLDDDSYLFIPDISDYFKEMIVNNSEYADGCDVEGFSFGMKEEVSMFI